jgi:hypothetical protein
MIRQHTFGAEYIETAEIVLINPIYPPVLGDFLKLGDTPRPRQEVSCTSFSAVYL